MTNNEKLKQAFLIGLRIDDVNYSLELEYNTIPEWDSTGHMALIVAVEKHFDVMLDMDDIIDMSSVAMAQKILNKYDVVF